MAEGDLYFDWGLLEDAQAYLQQHPEMSAVQAAGATVADPGLFGTVDGGAAAGQRVQAWLKTAGTHLQAVADEVTALAAGAGEAAQIARDLDPHAEAIAARDLPEFPFTFQADSSSDQSVDIGPEQQSGVIDSLQAGRQSTGEG